MRTFCLIISLLIVSLACAKPNRPALPPAKVEPALPNLSGETNWGTWEQFGRVISITGHPEWKAAGRVRDDNKVSILWTYLVDGSIAVSIYKLDEDGTLYGEWGYSADVTTREDGSLEGEVESDHIFRMEPGRPDL